LDEIRDAAAFAVNQLDWEKLKELQLKVITVSVAGQNDLAFFQHRLRENLMLCTHRLRENLMLCTGYGKTVCYACLPLLFDHFYQLEDSQRSIGIVVMPFINGYHGRHFLYCSYNSNIAASMSLLGIDRVTEKPPQ